MSIINYFRNRHLARQREEALKDAYVEKAERELVALQTRADVAVRILSTRHDRNHYGEAIAHMIQGAR